MSEKARTKSHPDKTLPDIIPSYKIPQNLTQSRINSLKMMNMLKPKVINLKILQISR